MNYATEYYYIPQYEHTSTNQHGRRYKMVSHKKVIVATLSCTPNDTDGLKRLILLSDRLQVPVRYDFEKQMAYIELMSADTVRKAGK